MGPGAGVHPRLQDTLVSGFVLHNSALLPEAQGLHRLLCMLRVLYRELWELKVWVPLGMRQREEAADALPGGCITNDVTQSGLSHAARHHHRRLGIPTCGAASQLHQQIHSKNGKVDRVVAM